MTSFTLIQKGDTVFDKTQSVKGVVTDINRSTNIAQVKSDSDNDDEVVLCKLHHLTRLSNSPFATSATHVVSTTGSNKCFHQVKEFHKAFNHPVADKPTHLTPERAVARSVWTVEEVVEFLQSSVSNESEFLHLYDQLLEGMEKAKQKSLADGFPKTNKQKLVAQSDALVDTMYFILGSFVEAQVEPDRLFDIVQSANMSKLFTSEDGTKYAKYRESDGKILKSPEFFDPEPLLKEEINRQLNQ